MNSRTRPPRAARRPVLVPRGTFTREAVERTTQTQLPFMGHIDVRTPSGEFRLEVKDHEAVNVLQKIWE